MVIGESSAPRKISMPLIKFDLERKPLQLHLREVEEQLADLKSQSKLHPDFIPLIIHSALSRILDGDRDAVATRLTPAMKGEMPTLQIIPQDTTRAFELLKRRVEEKKK